MTNILLGVSCVILVLIVIGLNDIYKQIRQCVRNIDYNHEIIRQQLDDMQITFRNTLKSIDLNVGYVAQIEDHNELIRKFDKVLDILKNIESEASFIQSDVSEIKYKK